MKWTAVDSDDEGADHEGAVHVTRGSAEGIIIIGIHYVHIDPCQLRNCNYVIGEYACAKYLGVRKNDCVNTKHERVIVNTKRKQVIMRGKLLQFKVIQINLLSSGGSWIID